MSATVTYKGVEIATVENETKTLNTAGTYCEADIEVTDVSSGGVQTTLVSGICATDILYYTNENMAARSGYEIIDLNLPVGTLIFVYNTGPTVSDPVGVTKLKEYGTPMKGQYILYMVGETHDGGSND